MANYYFLVVLAVWLFVAIANREARLLFSDKLTSIVTGDWETIKKAKDTFTHLKKELNTAIERSLGQFVEYLQYWMRQQYKSISGEADTPWKLLGYLFQIFLLAGFLYADAIVISNNLYAINLPIQIPVALQRYEFAITLGSFFSVIAGALVANELYGKSEFSDWKEQVGLWRNMAGVVSLFLIFSGIIVIIALGLARFTFVSNLPVDTAAQYQSFVNVIIYLLVPVNTMLASMLIIREGVKGVLALTLIVIGVLVVIFSVFIYLLRIISTLVIFLSDIAYRILIFLLSLIGFFIFTPIDTVTALFRKRM